MEESAPAEAFCPELPAGVQQHTITKQTVGFVLQPCIKERCAKYYGCQIMPQKIAEFFAHSALKLS